MRPWRYLQDVWFWSDRRLVLGVLPVGLAYHIGYTVLAVLGLVVRHDWPRDLEGRLITAIVVFVYLGPEQA